MAEEKKPHSLTLNQRHSLTVTGVGEVLRFEDTVAVMQTELGSLVIQGEDLQLKDLTREGGRVSVEGQIAAISYEEPRRSFWRGRR